MPAVTLVSPLLPGKQEAWRRFCQKLLEARCDEYQEFCKRLGIIKEQVWLSQTPQVDIVIVHLEAEHPEQMLLHLAASNHSFDHWFRRQLLELHGFDLAQLSVGIPNGLIFAWQLLPERLNLLRQIALSTHITHKGEHFMSTETNKALVRRQFEEGMNQNNVSVIDELIDPNYVNYDFPAPAPGREGFKQVIGMFRAAFPDMHVTLEDEIAEGDKVVTRGYFSGTHQGEFQGIAPTGKQIHVKYIDIWRVENGKLVENWIQMDMLGLLQQLGVIPPMG